MKFCNHDISKTITAWIVKLRTLIRLLLSQIWVHIVCNIGYQTTKADKIADDKGGEWQEKG